MNALSSKSPQAAVPSAPVAVPIPPRYWWLKRVLAASAVLLLALAVLRWWWGREAERRFDARIAAYRDAGEPVLPEDFRLPPIPDEENAAWYLTKAAESLRGDPQRVPAELDAIAEFADKARQLVEANSKTLELAHVAGDKPRADWRVPPVSPVINVLMPHLGPQRNLARLLRVTAVRQHYLGDDAGALVTVSDIVAQADAVGYRNWSGITSIVSVAIHAMAVDAVEEIAPRLTVVDVGVATASGTEPARREQVRALIDTLLDETRIMDSRRWMLYGERMAWLDMWESIIRSGSGAGGAMRLWNALFLPMYRLDMGLGADLYTANIEGGLAETYPATMAKMPKFQWPENGFVRRAHALTAATALSQGRLLELSFRLLAMRRMAATALAIRLYEIDHTGRPAGLEQLVPDYLPAVPSDPFSRDGRPLGYSPNAPKPVLYSIGSDGVDDGGRYALDNDGRVDNEVLDLVFFLNGDDPWVMPESLLPDPNSAETRENQSEEEGDGGQSDQDQQAEGD